MEMYFKVHGNLDVPFDFQIPSCSPWPTWSWEQKLGRQVVEVIRTGNLTLSEEEKDVLDSMDFKWGPKGRTPLRELRKNVSSDSKA